MRLFEFYSENKQVGLDRFFKQQDDIERVYNREAYKAKEDQQQWYADRNMTEDETPVFDVPLGKPQDKWTITPADNERTSPGYRGLQNAKRRAGHQDVNKKVHHEDPHAHPALPADEAEIIANANKRLGT